MGARQYSDGHSRHHHAHHGYDTDHRGLPHSGASAARHTHRRMCSVYHHATCGVVAGEGIQPRTGTGPRHPARRLLSWRRVEQHHVVSVPRRCGLLGRHDLCVDPACASHDTPLDATDGRRDNQDRRCRHVYQHPHRDRHTGCNRLVPQLHVLASQVIPCHSVADARLECHLPCMHSGRSDIYRSRRPRESRPHTLPLDICRGALPQFARLPAGLAGRTSSRLQHSQEAHHIDRGRYAECRTGHRPCQHILCCTATCGAPMCHQLCLAQHQRHHPCRHIRAI